VSGHLVGPYQPDPAPTEVEHVLTMRELPAGALDAHCSCGGWAQSDATSSIAAAVAWDKHLYGDE
jgi:hypothetical protein